MASDEEYERLADMIGALGEHKARMRPKDREFVEDQERRIDEDGADIWMSARQWAWLTDLHERYCG